MRLVFAGTPQVAVTALDAITASGHDLVAVVTRPDARVGRGRQLRRSPVAEWAAARKIELLAPQRLQHADFLDRLRELAPDCCPVVAYGALIPPTALEIPEQGWVNLHFSVLPNWRGAAPVQWAVIAGDDVTGATTFRLVPELDAGPVYGSLIEPIGPRDTAGQLLDRLATAGSRLLVDTLDGIEAGALQPQAQPTEQITYAPKLDPADAELDWSTGAVVLDRLIRGCDPQPGAWTTWRGERLKVLRARPESLVETGGNFEAGELQVRPDAVRVGTGAGVLVLEVVQPQGRKPMPAPAWAHGAHPVGGERLGA